MMFTAMSLYCSPRDRQDTLTNLTETNLTGSESLISFPVDGGSSINFGKINDIFQSMKIEQSIKNNPSGRV